MCLDGLDEIAHSLGTRGHQHEDRNMRLELQVTHRLRRAVAVGLVDHHQVGDLEQAGLGGLDRIAGTGVEDHDRRVGHRGDLDLGLTHPDALQQHGVVPERAEQADGGRDRGRQTTDVTAGRDRTDQHVGIVDVGRHPDPIAQQRAPLYGEDGSTANTATRCPRSRYAATSTAIVVDLPAPGGPVTPITGTVTEPTSASTSARRSLSTRLSSRPYRAGVPAAGRGDQLGDVHDRQRYVRAPRPL